MKRIAFVLCVLALTAAHCLSAEIPNGSLDQYIQFVGMQSADPTAAFTGGTSFTVKYIVNGGTLTTMTTPTVTEKADGLYVVLCDESGMTTIPDSNDTANLLVQIAHAGMVTVWREATIREPMATIAQVQADLATDAKQDTIIGYVDGIEAKTNNIPASPAAVGSQMTLADDAITAAKYDESTAFPLKSADTGSTAVARTGADADTLKTLSDQLDGVGSAADPWATTAGGYDEGTFGDLVQNSMTEAELIKTLRMNVMEAAIDADPNTGSLLAIIKELDTLRAQLASMIESDGSTGWEYTAGALVNVSATVEGEVTVAAASVSAIQSGLATAAALDTVDNYLDTEIAAIINLLGTPAGASISADIATIDNFVDTEVAGIVSTLGVAGAGLTAIPWNSAWDAEAQSEATDALNAYDPPTNAEMEARTLVAASYFDPTTDDVYLADGAHGGSAATLTMKQVAVTNTDAGGVAVSFTGSGTGNSHALQLTSTNGKALAAGSTNSDAVSINSTNASGMVVVGATGDIVSDITGQVSGTADLLPDGFADNTMTDGKLDVNATVGDVTIEGNVNLTPEAIDAIFNEVIKGAHEVYGTLGWYLNAILGGQ